MSAQRKKNALGFDDWFHARYPELIDYFGTPKPPYGETQGGGLANCMEFMLTRKAWNDALEAVAEAGLATEQQIYDAGLWPVAPRG